MSAKGRGKLKKTAKESGQAEYIWDSRAGNTPVNGYRALVTNNVADNLTKGSGTTPGYTRLFTKALIVLSPVRAA